MKQHSSLQCAFAFLFATRSLHLCTLWSFSLKGQFAFCFYILFLSFTSSLFAFLSLPFSTTYYPSLSPYLPISISLSPPYHLLLDSYLLPTTFPLVGDRCVLDCCLLFGRLNTPVGLLCIFVISLFSCLMGQGQVEAATCLVFLPAFSSLLFLWFLCVGKSSFS